LPSRTSLANFSFRRRISNSVGWWGGIRRRLGCSMSWLGEIESKGRRGGEGEICDQCECHILFRGLWSAQQSPPILSRPTHHFCYTVKREG
jgi:hypothetical protein